MTAPAGPAAPGRQPRRGPPGPQPEGTLLTRSRGTARGQGKEMTHRHRSQLTDLTTAPRL